MRDLATLVNRAEENPALFGTLFAYDSLNLRHDETYKLPSVFFDSAKPEWPKPGCLTASFQMYSKSVSKGTVIAQNLNVPFHNNALRLNSSIQKYPWTPDRPWSTFETSVVSEADLLVHARSHGLGPKGWLTTMTTDHGRMAWLRCLFLHQAVFEEDKSAAVRDSNGAGNVWSEMDRIKYVNPTDITREIFYISFTVGLCVDIMVRSAY